MKTGRSCPHCKSPSIGNPCFWEVDRPAEWAGYDAPCYGERDRERIAKDDPRLWRIWIALVLIGLAIGGWLWAFVWL